MENQYKRLIGCFQSHYMYDWTNVHILMEGPIKMNFSNMDIYIYTAKFNLMVLQWQWCVHWEKINMVNFSLEWQQ